MRFRCFYHFPQKNNNKPAKDDSKQHTCPHVFKVYGVGDTLPPKTTPLFTSTWCVLLCYSSPFLFSPMIKTNSSHAFQCMNGLHSLRTDGKLIDVRIVAGGATFNAHRAILSSCSPYFSAMFTGEMKESENPSVTIHDIPSHIMEAILNYCYTATISITEDNVQELLPAACLLQLAWVRDVCCEFLKSQLCSSNCLGVRSFADAHSCPDLRDAAHSYALKHYLEVFDIYFK